MSCWQSFMDNTVILALRMHCCVRPILALRMHWRCAPQQMRIFTFLIGKGKFPCSIAYPDLHHTERNDTYQRKEEGRQETETLDRGQRTGGKEKET